MKNLKVGDSVLVNIGYGYRCSEYIDKIDCETAKFWKIKSRKFYKEDGQRYGGDGRLTILTEDKKNEILRNGKIRSLKYKITESLKGLNNLDFSVDKLENILKAIKD